MLGEKEFPAGQDTDFNAIDAMRFRPFSRSEMTLIEVRQFPFMMLKVVAISPENLNGISPPSINDDSASDECSAPDIERGLPDFGQILADLTPIQFLGIVRLVRSVTAENGFWKNHPIFRLCPFKNIQDLGEIRFYLPGNGELSYADLHRRLVFSWAKLVTKYCGDEG